VHSFPAAAADGAAGAGKKLYRLNGTTASTGDIKALIADLGGFDAMGGVVLYLDEIQYLNKKQQQTLLEYIEDGSITLIASTTENPYFYVYNAILSRCTVFEFKPVDAAEVEHYLESAMEKLRQQSPELQVEEGALAHIAACCGGDVRKAANAPPPSTSAFRILSMTCKTGSARRNWKLSRAPCTS